MKHGRSLAVALALAASTVACAGRAGAPTRVAVAPTIAADARFMLVPLGTAGGLDESNLTSFLVAPRGDDRWVALDAGTLYAGMRASLDRRSLDPGGPVTEALVSRTLARRVRAVLLSHPHFDHVAGLVLNSPEDGPRALYGTAATMDALRDHVFNNVVWANFLDEGAPPRLGRYHPVRLVPGEERALDGTAFRATAFELAHGRDGGSTAFLLRSDGGSVLYVGDTGPDAVERSTRLASLWTAVAPLVRDRSLRAVLLECSYPSERPDARLFSHLTPRWVRAELDALAARVAGADSGRALEGLTVVLTHAKPGSSDAPRARDTLEAQLGREHRGARLVWPEQGVALGL